MRSAINYQADTIVDNQWGPNLATLKGLRAWRNMLITAVKSTKAKGGCPLAALGGQLAETDLYSRALIAAGFERWFTAISDGLRTIYANGQLSPNIDPRRFGRHSPRSTARGSASRPGGG